MMTELTLLRDRFTERSTTGVLLIDSQYQCLVLEDRIRAPGVKVPGSTCIPAGRYRIIRTHSRRFGRVMPLLVDVPGFSGVRIHAGNTSEDTEGCLLVGTTRGVDSVSLSRIAFQAFDRAEYEADKKGEVWINIINVNVPKELLT